MSSTDSSTRTTTIERPDGTALATTSTGSGDPVLLIHGYTANSTIWQCVIDELAPETCAIHTIDLRGHGGSTPLRAPTTVHDLLADVVATVEKLDLTGAVLVGHSLGGMVLQTLAAEHPDLFPSRVRALLLVNTSGNPMGSRTTRLTGSLLQSRVVDLIAKSPRLSTAFARTAFPTGASADRLAIQASMRIPERCSRLHFDVAVGDLLPGNARVSVPTTILASTKDLAIPVAATAELAESIPHSRLRLVPGTGHLLPLERPEIVATEIRRLLAT